MTSFTHSIYCFIIILFSFNVKIYILKGLKSNTITGVEIENVHLKYDHPFKNCELVEGVFSNSPGVEKCKLLKERHSKKEV